ncbi:MAG: hypothetical protein OXU40_03960 [Nitrospira sp.]|nr:hypothetical protein [Nitrospira sp.]
MPKSRRSRSSRKKPGAVHPEQLPTESEPETGRSSRTQPSVVLCAAVLLLTGAVLRLIYLGEIPAGMFTDEASVGYEAWSLLHHGIDRNGYAWPVHFVAWGSGQNVLYSYLSIPLIAVFDLTMFSIRLLMALTGTASLLLFWRVAARDQPAFALLALLLLTFCPWHLMLSRWALECNLLPFVVLLAVYCLTRPDNDRLGIQAAGVFVLSLSVYAYTAAYFFAPVFLALVFGWLRVQGKLPLRHFVLLSTLSLLTVLPILLFLAVNFFGWEAIRAGISIPKYPGQARYETLSTLFGGRFRSHFFDHLLFAVKVLTTSDPSSVPEAFRYFNKLPHFSVLFPLAIVPLAVGFGATLFRAVTRRECGVPLLMALWLIAAFATNSITLVNINRANVVWVPAVYFTALGVFYACHRWRALLTLAGVAYLIYGGWFVQTYFTHYNDPYDRGVVIPHDFHDLQPVISSVIEHASPSDKIYITQGVFFAYIHTMFHTKIPPQDYLNTRTIIDPNVPFQEITSFGRFIFAPERINEADHLIMRSDPGQRIHPYGPPHRSLILHSGQRVMLFDDEVAVLDAATLSKCAHEQQGNFVVLHCA